MTRHRNPVGSRLAGVERQHRPEVAAWVTDTVLFAANTPSEQDVAESWEDQIFDLAAEASRIFKAVRKGRMTEAEGAVALEGLRDRFYLLVAEHEVVTELGPALTPKEVRQRVQSRSLRGLSVVADLGEGYTAVEATPDLAAPPFPAGDPNEPTQAMVDWVDAFAPFQQVMGVGMNNCLQFYRVNYAPYGKGKFGVQRRGGKLYAVLDPMAQPVAATLTDPEGTVIETNGRKNKPPRGADGQALDRFEALMGWDASARGVLDVPGTDEQLAQAVEWVLDEVYTEGLERAEYLDRATSAARQDGFDGARVATAWQIYLLVGSPYSARRSAEASGYKRAGDVVAAIDQVAFALGSGDPDARTAAADAARAAWAAGGAEPDAAGEAAWEAAGAALYAARSAGAADPDAAFYAARRDYADELLELMEAEARGELEVRAANPRHSNALKRRLMP